MLAHYMNDKEYTNEILHGDIHTANQKLAGLESRDQAKTFIYAFLYGAGDAKLGTIVVGNARTGSALRARFLDGLPTLRDLTERVQRDAEKGILEGLDGRLLHVRSAHAALNTLLQGAGAIVMKKALTILDEYARLWKLNYSFIGNIHDEVQSEVQPEQADKFGALAVSCLEAAGLAFDLNCPLTGEYSVGRNWSETH
jgi:DNA polymerase I-like protein with 3'-5' exonuclease and polymerase domains